MFLESLTVLGSPFFCRIGRPERLTPRRCEGLSPWQSLLFSVSSFTTNPPIRTIAGIKNNTRTFWSALCHVGVRFPRSLHSLGMTIQCASLRGLVASRGNLIDEETIISAYLWGYSQQLFVHSFL